MTVSRKDLAATALTILVVLAFAATHEGWNVALIGDNHRWAAAVIFVLGVRPARRQTSTRPCSSA
jgi:hypothetical protein